MKTLKLKPIVSSFAENKDLARNLRIEKIIPALEKNEEVTLDFVVCRPGCPWRVAGRGGHSGYLDYPVGQCRCRRRRYQGV